MLVIPQVGDVLLVLRDAGEPGAVCAVCGAKVCGANVSRLIARTGGITVTGTSDDSAEIQRVQLTTRLDVTYSNGTTYGQA